MPGTWHRRRQLPQPQRRYPRITAEGPAITIVAFIATDRGLSNGSIRSRDNATNNYATARNGTGVLELYGGYHVASQTFTGGDQYNVTEGFMDFDTSALPDGLTIVNARLDLYGGIVGALYGTTAPSQNVEFRWGDQALPIVASTDYVPGGSLASDTLIGTATDTNFDVAETPFSVTLTDYSGISATGTTKIYCNPERLRTNNAPSSGSTNFETMTIWSTAYSLGLKGNNSRSPVLTIEYFVSGTNAAATLASGTGSASNASVSLAPNASVGAGTGAALDATVTTDTFTNASAELASATGATLDATTLIAVSTGAASGAGTAFDPTISTAASTDAPAELASGTGAAFSASVSIAPNAGLGSGSGAAYGATVTAVNGGFAPQVIFIF